MRGPPTPEPSIRCPRWDLCAAEGLWLHADAAYGGGALTEPRGWKAPLAGIERVDSLALDPQWLFQPFEIGCVLLRDAGLMADVFHTRPDYLRDVHRAGEEVHFSDLGIQLTRSFRALKLWMSLQVFGLSAARAAVERGIENAEIAEECLARSGRWRIVAPAQLGTVAFRWGPKESPSSKRTRSRKDSPKLRWPTVGRSSARPFSTAVRPSACARSIRARPARISRGRSTGWSGWRCHATSGRCGGVVAYGSSRTFPIVCRFSSSACARRLFEGGAHGRCAPAAIPRPPRT